MMSKRRWIITLVLLVGMFCLWNISTSSADEQTHIEPTLLPIEQSPDLLMYPPELLAIQQAGGTWSERFDHNSWINQNQVVAVMVWWLVIMAFGACSWGVLFFAFPKLTDRGYGVAKLIGLILVTWILYSLGTLRFEVWHQLGIIVVMVGLIAVNLAFGWFQRVEMLAHIRQHWRLMLFIEVFTFILFGLLLLIRSTNPDLWSVLHTGERAMDFAYLNGVLRSTIFPPLDPWFAGGYNNYYYLGFVISATPILLTAIIPSIGYNLMLSTVYALAGVGLFSLGYNIACALNLKRCISPYIAGVMAFVLALVAGNLDIPRILFNAVSEIGGYEDTYGYINYYIREAHLDYQTQHGDLPSAEMQQAIVEQVTEAFIPISFNQRLTYELSLASWRMRAFFTGLHEVLFEGATPVNDSLFYWMLAPSRTISLIPSPVSDRYVYDTAISETALTSFLYGDLHAHLISQPLMLFSLLFVFHETVIAGHDRRNFLGKLIALALGALIVAWFRGVNTWEYPTFMILNILALCFAWWNTNANKFFFRAICSLIVCVGGFILLTLLTILPYTTWYQSGEVYLAQWKLNKTPIWAYVMIHGLFLFLIVSMLILETAKHQSLKAFFFRWRRFIPFFVGGCLTLILTVAGYQVALITVPLIVWVMVLFFQKDQTRVMQYSLVLMGLALAITLGVEFLKINIDIGRQNIVFKFYVQAWIIFSGVGGVAVAYGLEAILNYPQRFRRAWAGTLIVLLMIALLYPIYYIALKNQTRLADDVPWTLDGMAYMQYANLDYLVDGREYGHVLSQDYHIIRWLQDNVQGTPTIIEAEVGAYYWNSRISIYTGLPTVFGWDHHQSQQRRGDLFRPHLENRSDNVRLFYKTTQVIDSARILNHYDVEYVILGDYERNVYGITEDQGELGELKRDKFDQMVDLGIIAPVYQVDGQTIYQVNREGLRQYLMMGTE